jgi:hypothetical protein
MVKRSTLVMVVLFVAALAILFLVRRDPSIMQTATPTPVSTPMSKMLPDWNAADIVSAKLERAVGGVTELTRNSEGSWTNKAFGPLEPGKVEQLLAELLATNILVVLPADYSLEDLKLTTPAQTITLQDASGRETRIMIGGTTPSQSGYYLRVDGAPPIAVSKYAVEAVLKLFDEALPAPTETPTS